MRVGDNILRFLNALKKFEDASKIEIVKKIIKLNIIRLERGLIYEKRIFAATYFSRFVAVFDKLQ